MHQNDQPRTLLHYLQTERKSANFGKFFTTDDLRLASMLQNFYVQHPEGSK